MTRYVIALAAALIAALVFLPDGATAAPTGTTCSGSGCFTDSLGELRVNDSAATESLEFEWCPGVAVTTMVAAQYVSGAKFLYCENRSSATVYVTLDAVSLTTTGSTGWKFAAGTERGWAIEAGNFAPSIRAAATAATTTGACLWCAWLK